MAKGWTDKRPMSPHLSVWKWHPTMLSSILHRITGVVLYLGLIVLCVLMVSLAMGEAGFEKIEDIVYSPFGAFLFFAATGILIYHLLNGLRHLVWDMGRGFDPKLANTLSLFIVFVSAVLAALLTFLLIGRV